MSSASSSQLPRDVATLAGSSRRPKRASLRCPLEANLAWWDSQVEATEENADAEGARGDRAGRMRSPTASSSPPSDAARRNGAGGDVHRRLDLLHDLMLRHQMPDELSARIVELETSVDLRFSRHRGVVGGEEVGDTEIKRILRRSDDPARAARGLGGVEDRRRRRRGRRARARAPAERGCARSRPSRLVRAVAGD